MCGRGGGCCRTGIEVCIHAFFGGGGDDPRIIVKAKLGAGSTGRGMCVGIGSAYLCGGGGRGGGCKEGGGCVRH